MDMRQARAVKVGQRVFWQPDARVPKPGDFGTVIEKGFSAFKIAWDDGNECIYTYVHAGAIHMVGYMDVADPKAA